MKHCKWDTKYPDVSKEYKCNKPATVEVFEMGGHKVWNEDKTAIIEVPPASMGWLCPEHAELFNTGRNAVNGFVEKYFINNKPILTLRGEKDGLRTNIIQLHS